jgi:hypothetical protein
MSIIELGFVLERGGTGGCDRVCRSNGLPVGGNLAFAKVTLALSSVEEAARDARFMDLGTPRNSGVLGTP